MRTKVSFDVYGSTLTEIHRRAKTALAEFLTIEVDDLDSRVDVEVDIEQFNSAEDPATYHGRVFAKLK
jgi:SHS2 domain-containing protein